MRCNHCTGDFNHVIGSSALQLLLLLVGGTNIYEIGMLGTRVRSKNKYVCKNLGLGLGIHFEFIECTPLQKGILYKKVPILNLSKIVVPT